MLSEKDKNHLTYLILMLQEGAITSEQLECLDNWLAEDECAFSFYCEFMKDVTVMKRNIFSFDDENSPVSVNILKLLADYEQNASEIIIEKSDEPDVASDINKTVSRVKTNSFFAVFDKLVYIAAVLMIMFIVYAQKFSPEYSEPVAFVVDQIDVSWAKGSAHLKVNDILLTNQPPYKLINGIIKIQYDQGVDVLIEGPAEFEIDRQGLFVQEGSVYSIVSKSGRGFTIDTPNARFVDLGTEFGVNVSKTEISELHVLKGQVQLYAGLDDEDKDSRTISEGFAVRFDAKNGYLEDIAVKQNVFVREINSRTDTLWRGRNSLSLVNVIAGLDRGKHIEKPMGINPLKGEYDTPYFNDNIVTDNNYYTFKDSKYIDGVFVPDGGNGLVTISSTGLTFNCPNTSGKYTHNICIFQGGLNRDKSTILPPVFNGKDYESLSVPVLLLHSNSGITIDLLEVRENNPEYIISKFTAMGGITEAVIGAEGDEADVSVWVLVDGEVRYENKLIDVNDGIIDFDIELTNQDRFLTLIVSDALRDPDRRHYPWANDFFYLVQPELKLSFQSQ